MFPLMPVWCFHGTPQMKQRRCAIIIWGTLQKIIVLCSDSFWISYRVRDLHVLTQALFVQPVTFERFLCNLIQAMIVVVCLMCRQKIIRRESFSEEKWKKIYYLSNGNGSEMRWLAAFIWGSLTASGGVGNFGRDLFFPLKSQVISNFVFSFASFYAVSDAWNDT